MDCGELERMRGFVDTDFAGIYNPTTPERRRVMAVSRILYDLQNLDRTLDEARGRVAFIEESLGDRSELERREKALEDLRGRLRELDRKQRSLDFTSKSTKDRLDDIESKLYGGAVSNPRELQDLGRELQNVKRNLGEIDDEALENLVSLEEVEQEVSDGEAALAREEEAWSENQQDMEVEWEELSIRIEGMEERRGQAAKGLDAASLGVYERVRISRAGKAVAMVERGLCRACGVTQPTHFIQRARAGSEAVQCGSCGSILYAG